MTETATVASKGSMSAGKIAGIVVLGLVVAGGAGTLLFFLLRPKASDASSAEISVQDVAADALTDSQTLRVLAELRAQQIALTKCDTMDCLNAHLPPLATTGISTLESKCKATDDKIFVRDLVEFAPQVQLLAKVALNGGLCDSDVDVDQAKQAIDKLDCFDNVDALKALIKVKPTATTTLKAFAAPTAFAVPSASSSSASSSVSTPAGADDVTGDADSSAPTTPGAARPAKTVTKRARAAAATSPGSAPAARTTQTVQGSVKKDVATGSIDSAQSASVAEISVQFGGSAFGRRRRQQASQQGQNQERPRGEHQEQELQQDQAQGHLGDDQEERRNDDMRRHTEERRNIEEPRNNEEPQQDQDQERPRGERQGQKQQDKAQEHFGDDQDEHPNNDERRHTKERRNIEEPRNTERSTNQHRNTEERRDHEEPLEGHDQKEFSFQFGEEEPRLHQEVPVNLREQGPSESLYSQQTRLFEARQRQQSAEGQASYAEQAPERKQPNRESSLEDEDDDALDHHSEQRVRQETSAQSANNQRSPSDSPTHSESERRQQPQTTSQQPAQTANRRR